MPQVMLIQTSVLLKMQSDFLYNKIRLYPGHITLGATCF